MTIFLIAVALFHTDGEDFGMKRNIKAMSDYETCVITAEELKSIWRKNYPTSTILVECVPVALTEKV